MANVKHYAVNNQEGIGIDASGLPIGVGILGSRLTVNALVDERPLRELYLPHFEMAVTARQRGVGDVLVPAGERPLRLPEPPPADPDPARGLGLQRLRPHRLRRQQEHRAVAERRARPRHLAGLRLPAAAGRGGARHRAGHADDDRPPHPRDPADALRLRVLRPRRLRRRHRGDQPARPPPRRGAGRAARDRPAQEPHRPAAAQGEADRQPGADRPRGRHDQGRRRLVGDQRVQDHDAARRDHDGGSAPTGSPTTTAPTPCRRPRWRATPTSRWSWSATG